MKKLLIAVTALTALVAAPAMAADLPVKAPARKAPPPVELWSWTGIYVGANVGYGWGRSNTRTNFNDATSGALLATTNHSFMMDGVIGGGQIGANWQSGPVVWGVEADIQGSGQKGSFAFVCPTGFCAPAAAVTDRLTEKLLWFGTVRGRVGFTVTPEVLAYATGGLAYGDVKRDITVNGMNGVTPVSALFSNSTTRAGWTVGAGVEGHIGGGWTAKLEYLYVDLGTFTTGRFVTPIVAPSGNFLATNFSSRVTDNIVRLGVNYKFNSSIFPKY